MSYLNCLNIIHSLNEKLDIFMKSIIQISNEESVEKTQNDIPNKIYDFLKENTDNQNDECKIFVHNYILYTLQNTLVIGIANNDIAFLVNDIIGSLLENSNIPHITQDELYKIINDNVTEHTRLNTEYMSDIYNYIMYHVQNIITRNRLVFIRHISDIEDDEFLTIYKSIIHKNINIISETLLDIENNKKRLKYIIWINLVHNNYKEPLIKYVIEELNKLLKKNDWNDRINKILNIKGKQKTYNYLYRTLVNSDINNKLMNILFNNYHQKVFEKLQEQSDIRIYSFLDIKKIIIQQIDNIVNNIIDYSINDFIAEDIKYEGNKKIIKQSRKSIFIYLEKIYKLFDFYRKLLNKFDQYNYIFDNIQYEEISFKQNIKNIIIKLLNSLFDPFYNYEYLPKHTIDFVQSLYNRKITIKNKKILDVPIYTDFSQILVKINSNIDTMTKVKLQQHEYIFEDVYSIIINELVKNNEPYMNEDTNIFLYERLYQFVHYNKLGIYDSEDRYKNFISIYDFYKNLESDEIFDPQRNVKFTFFPPTYNWDNIDNTFKKQILQLKLRKIVSDYSKESLSLNIDISNYYHRISMNMNSEADFNIFNINYGNISEKDKNIINCYIKYKFRNEFNENLSDDEIKTIKKDILKFIRKDLNLDPTKHIKSEEKFFKDKYIENPNDEQKNMYKSYLIEQSKLVQEWNENKIRIINYLSEYEKKLKNEEYNRELLNKNNVFYVINNQLLSEDIQENFESILHTVLSINQLYYIFGSTHYNDYHTIYYYLSIYLHNKRYPLMKSYFDNLDESINSIKDIMKDSKEYISRESEKDKEKYLENAFKFVKYDFNINELLTKLYLDYRKFRQSSEIFHIKRTRRMIKFILYYVNVMDQFFIYPTETHLKNIKLPNVINDNIEYITLFDLYKKEINLKNTFINYYRSLFTFTDNNDQILEIDFKRNDEYEDNNIYDELLKYYHKFTKKSTNVKFVLEQYNYLLSIYKIKTLETNKSMKIIILITHKVFSILNNKYKLIDLIATMENIAYEENSDREAALFFLSIIKKLSDVNLSIYLKGSYLMKNKEISKYVNASKSMKIEINKSLIYKYLFTNKDERKELLNRIKQISLKEDINQNDINDLRILGKKVITIKKKIKNLYKIINTLDEKVDKIPLSEIFVSKKLTQEVNINKCKHFFYLRKMDRINILLNKIRSQISIIDNKLLINPDEEKELNRSKNNLKLKINKLNNNYKVAFQRYEDFENKGDHEIICNRCGILLRKNISEKPGSFRELQDFIESRRYLIENNLLNEEIKNNKLIGIMKNISEYIEYLTSNIFNIRYDFDSDDSKMTIDHSEIEFLYKMTNEEDENGPIYNYLDSKYNSAFMHFKKYVSKNFKGINNKQVQKKIILMSLIYYKFVACIYLIEYLLKKNKNVKNSSSISYEFIIEIYSLLSEKYNTYDDSFFNNITNENGQNNFYRIIYIFISKEFKESKIPFIGNKLIDIENKSNESKKLYENEQKIHRKIRKNYNKVGERIMLEQKKDYKNQLNNIYINKKDLFISELENNLGAIKKKKKPSNSILYGIFLLMKHDFITFKYSDKEIIKNNNINIQKILKKSIWNRENNIDFTKQQSLKDIYNNFLLTYLHINYSNYYEKVNILSKYENNNKLIEIKNLFNKWSNSLSIIDDINNIIEKDEFLEMNDIDDIDTLFLEQNISVDSIYIILQQYLIQLFNKYKKYIQNNYNYLTNINNLSYYFTDFSNDLFNIDKDILLYERSDQVTSYLISKYMSTLFDIQYRPDIAIFRKFVNELNDKILRKEKYKFSFNQIKNIYLNLNNFEKIINKQVNYYNQLYNEFVNTKQEAIFTKHKILSNQSSHMKQFTDIFDRKPIITQLRYLKLGNDEFIHTFIPYYRKDKSQKEVLKEFVEYDKSLNDIEQIPDFKHYKVYQNTYEQFIQYLYLFNNNNLLNKIQNILKNNISEQNRNLINNYITKLTSENFDLSIDINEYKLNVIENKNSIFNNKLQKMYQYIDSILKKNIISDYRLSLNEKKESQRKQILKELNNNDLYKNNSQAKYEKLNELLTIYMMNLKLENTYNDFLRKHESYNQYNNITNGMNNIIELNINDEEIRNFTNDKIKIISNIILSNKITKNNGNRLFLKRNNNETIITNKDISEFLMNFHKYFIINKHSIMRRKKPLENINDITKISGNWNHMTNDFQWTIYLSGKINKFHFNIFKLYDIVFKLNYYTLMNNYHNIVNDVVKQIDNIENLFNFRYKDAPIIDEPDMLFDLYYERHQNLFIKLYDINQTTHIILSNVQETEEEITKKINELLKDHNFLSYRTPNKVYYGYNDGNEYIIGDHDLVHKKYIIHKILKQNDIIRNKIEFMGEFIKEPEVLFENYSNENSSFY